MTLNTEEKISADHYLATNGKSKIKSYLAGHSDKAHLTRGTLHTYTRRFFAKEDVKEYLQQYKVTDSTITGKLFAHYEELEVLKEGATKSEVVRIIKEQGIVIEKIQKHIVAIDDIDGDIIIFADKEINVVCPYNLDDVDYDEAIQIINHIKCSSNHFYVREGKLMEASVFNFSHKNKEEKAKANEMFMSGDYGFAVNLSNEYVLEQ